MLNLRNGGKWGNPQKGTTTLLFLFYVIIPYSGFIVNKNGIFDNVFSCWILTKFNSKIQHIAQKVTQTQQNADAVTAVPAFRVIQNDVTLFFMISGLYAYSIAVSAVIVPLRYISRIQLSMVCIPGED